MNIIGLGKAGCAIADKFAQYPQYDIYKIDVGLKGYKKNGIYDMPAQKSPEQYEAKCPSMRTFFKKHLQKWPAKVGYCKSEDGPWFEVWNDGS